MKRLDLNQKQAHISRFTNKTNTFSTNKIDLSKLLELLSKINFSTPTQKPAQKSQSNYKNFPTYNIEALNKMQEHQNIVKRIKNL